MAQTTAARPAARRAPTEAQAKAKAHRQAARADALPDWSALGGPTGRVSRQTGRAHAGAQQASKRASAKSAAQTRVRPLDAVPSVRFGALTVLACVVVTLFVSHVYATRATLDALQEARRDNERLRLTHQRLSGAFDRMTAPDRVMPQALRLGLVEGIAYGPPIALDAERPTD